MATLREQQLAEIRKSAKKGEFHKSDVKEISKSALTKGLTELVNSGEIERIGTGLYRAAGATPAPSKIKSAPKSKVKAKPEPKAKKAAAKEVDSTDEIVAVTAATHQEYKVIVNGTTFGSFAMSESEIKDMVSKLQPNSKYSKTVKNEIHFTQRTADKN